MTVDIPTVGGEESLADTFEALQKKQTPVVAVVDGNQKLLGYVNSENLAELMMLRASSRSLA